MFLNSVKTEMIGITCRKNGEEWNSVQNISTKWCQHLCKSLKWQPILYLRA